MLRRSRFAFGQPLFQSLPFFGDYGLVRLLLGFAPDAEL